MFTILYICITLELIVIISLLITKNNRNKLLNLTKEHAEHIDRIRKEHSETIENIRIDTLKREDVRSRQWIESEKETLNVLNGVSIILDLNDKISRSDTQKILIEINKLHELIEEYNNKAK